MSVGRSETLRPLEGFFTPRQPLREGETCGKLSLYS
jgi:hypothetical protein